MISHRTWLVVFIGHLKSVRQAFVFRCRVLRREGIVLGAPYDPALDMWSIGCTLYELYTGKILFPGRSNNHMLLLMMELKGRFNNKTIKKARFGDMYFDDLGGFQSVENDRVTGAVSQESFHNCSES